MSGRVVALAETFAALAVTAWVGGHAALGAFAARIIFRDLPRGIAAPTMTTIFRSFDGVLIACAIVLLIAIAARAIALHARAIDRLALLIGALLVMLGLFEYFYVHPSIEQMFQAGRTLEPAFASLHKLSERCGHLEVIFTAALLGTHALSRRGV